MLVNPLYYYYTCCCCYYCCCYYYDDDYYKVRRIVDILNSCTHNGFPVVYSQEVRRACYHEMGPKLPEVQVAVQGDPGSKVSPEASKASAGTSEGEISEISPEDSTEVLGRRPSVRFAQEAEAGGTKADSRRGSFASSTSSASTVEDRLNSLVDQRRAEQTPSASSRSSPGFLRAVTAPRLSRAGSVAGSGTSLESISRRSSKANDADKLKDAAVAAEVGPPSQHGALHGALGGAQLLTLRLLGAHLKALGSSTLQGGKRPGHWAPGLCLGCSSEPLECHRFHRLV